MEDGKQLRPSTENEWPPDTEHSDNSAPQTTPRRRMPAKTDVNFPAFMSPEEIDEVLFTEEMLKKRVAELGREISNSYTAPAKPAHILKSTLYSVFI
jgi:hypothetical protein